jgi:hypothetical protein
LSTDTRDLTLTYYTGQQIILKFKVDHMSYRWQEFSWKLLVPLKILNAFNNKVKLCYEFKILLHCCLFWCMMCFAI